MPIDNRETVRRLMAVALDERAPMNERTAMALQAVRLIAKYKLLEVNAASEFGLPSSKEEIRRKVKEDFEEAIKRAWEQRTKHDVGAVYARYRADYDRVRHEPGPVAEPIRVNNKVWSFNESTELLESTERSLCFSFSWSSTVWLPKDHIIELIPDHSSVTMRFRVSIDYRYARIAGFAAYHDRGTVKDV